MKGKKNQKKGKRITEVLMKIMQKIKILELKKKVMEQKIKQLMIIKRQKK